MKKVVFFGGKLIGYKCLKALCAHPQIELSLVVANTSDLYDGNDRWYPKIYELAKSYKRPYLSTDNPNSESVISIIKGLNPDLIFVVYYDAILKPELFKLAKEGTINLHLADAEKYRGCYPTTYAIINGEKNYGVTLHYIDEGVDSGPIINKKIFKLKEGFTGKDLYEKATIEGHELFDNYLNDIVNGTIKARKQVESEHIRSYRRSQFPSHNISFEGTGREVYSRIKALIFPPFPSPYFYIGRKKFEIVPKDDN